MIDHYYQMYDGSLRYPGWEVAEKHKSSLNLNIPTIAQFPTPQLPSDYKRTFERLYEKRKRELIKEKRFQIILT